MDSFFFTPYKIGYIINLIDKVGGIALTRTFIEIPLFTKRWSEIGLTDDDLFRLQMMLLKDPESGPVIEGTGGIRKVRFPMESRGKSGSVRVCYTDFAEYEVTYLITAFTKNEQDNLTNDEKKVLRKLVKSLRDAERDRRSQIPLAPVFWAVTGSGPYGRCQIINWHY